MEVAFELDGREVVADVPPGLPLRDVIRERVGETAVKAGCQSGRCGVCTVLLDGRAVKSCLVLAPKADGRSVTTARGLAAPGGGAYADTGANGGEAPEPVDGDDPDVEAGGAGGADGEGRETLHAVQRAFREEFAVQCGYCTPGFVLTAAAFLEEEPDPDRDRIWSAIKGNVCRCTGYENIVDAVDAAANAIADDGPANDASPDD